jgi:ubiquinone/menaquinone biosynthesis C-methylase UbiE
MTAQNDALTQCLKATADPVRLHLLHILGRNSYGALELSYILGVKQNSLSHHLKLLSAVGLIESRREGNSLYYRRAVYEGPYPTLVTALINTLDSQVLTSQHEENMRMVQQERVLQSQEFFDKHAMDFKQQQELIASFDSYAEVAAALLLNKGQGHQHAVEIGPGTGEFLEVLSRNFDQVTAVDVSRDMLEQAKVHCQTHNLNNVTLIHGDQSQLQGLNQTVDAAVFNMVLHHVALPAQELAAAANLLKPKGVLLVTDLCRHDQDWARNSCGDLWLGFDPKELQQWAAQSGLEPIQTTYVGLRNGFQIQCQIFSKL